MTNDELKSQRPHVYNDVLNAHAAGLSPARIARRSGISTQTVEAVLATVEVAAEE